MADRPSTEPRRLNPDESLRDLEIGAARAQLANLEVFAHHDFPAFERKVDAAFAEIRGEQTRHTVEIAKLATQVQLVGRVGMLFAGVVVAVLGWFAVDTISSLRNEIHKNASQIERSTRPASTR